MCLHQEQLLDAKRHEDKEFPENNHLQKIMLHPANQTWYEGYVPSLAPAWQMLFLQMTPEKSYIVPVKEMLLLVHVTLKELAGHWSILLAFVILRTKTKTARIYNEQQIF